jgi:hypothetical protein
MGLASIGPTECRATSDDRVNSFCSTRRTIVSAIKNVRQIGVGIRCGFAALPSKPDARSDVYGSASQIDSFIELPLAQRIS